MKELGYDERGKPMARRKIKILKWALQGAKMRPLRRRNAARILWA
jgi:hypothetical protein